jgi:hypothetical protein
VYKSQVGRRGVFVLRKSVPILLCLGMSLAWTQGFLARPAFADHNTCGPDDGSDVNNPHYSSGARGIIVKGRIHCSGNPWKIENWYLEIWWCGELHPQSDESFLVNNCQLMGHDFKDKISPVNAGDTFTMYAPPQSETGARKDGWYKACEWYDVWDHHSGTDLKASPLIFSNSVYCTNVSADGGNCS